MSDDAEEVLIIGNGFDNAHHIPTSYCDFLKVLVDVSGFYEECCKVFSGFCTPSEKWKKIIGDNRALLDMTKVEELRKILLSNSWAKYYARCNAEIDGWIDFEKEMLPVLKLFFDIFSADCNVVDYKGGYRGLIQIEENNIKRISGLFEKYFDNKCFFGGFYGIVLSDRFVDSNYGILKKTAIKELREELLEFTRAFGIYLELFASLERVNTLRFFETKEYNRIISFNYTYTANKYKNLSQISIDFVHGEYLKPETMIFGVDGLSEKEAEYFKEFEKSFRRIKNSTKPSYKDITNKGLYNLTIYGHSLDNNDKSIIKPFIDNSIQTKIYCYNPDDYDLKVKNLMLMYKDKKAAELLYDGKVELLMCES